MASVEFTTYGRATAAALLKFGSVVVQGETWEAFVEEVGVEEKLVAACLAELRLRGYCQKDAVPHPHPRPGVEWSLEYTATGRELPQIPNWPVLDTETVTDQMYERRA